MNGQQDKEAIYSSEPARPGFEELLARYVAELPPKVAGLAKVRGAGDAAEAEDLLHQLAGSLGLYGYAALESKCRALLARLRCGDTVVEIAPRIAELEQELGRVRARPSL